MEEFILGKNNNNGVYIQSIEANKIYANNKLMITLGKYLTRYN